MCGVTPGVGGGDGRRPGAACSRSRGANLIHVKPNGGLGLWDVMNPSQGTINLEQTGEVQRQVPEEVRNEKGVFRD